MTTMQEDWARFNGELRKLTIDITNALLPKLASLGLVTFEVYARLVVAGLTRSYL